MTEKIKKLEIERKYSTEKTYSEKIIFDTFKKWHHSFLGDTKLHLKDKELKKMNSKKYAEFCTDHFIILKNRK